ncbi:MAG: hypothetical protein ACTSPV_10630, partial [Candidatus Hodarchaeales archaeon]
TRNAFQKAIIEIQEKLTLEDLGIIDDMFLGPEIKKIISRHFPVTLLSKFIIDTNKIRELEETCKYRKLGISKNALILLKKIIAIRLSPGLQDKDEKTQIKFYNTEISKMNNTITFPFLYPEVLTICQKVIGAPVDITYEALWKGASESIKLLREER